MLFAFQMSSLVKCLFRNFAHPVYLLLNFDIFKIYPRYHFFARNVICRCFLAVSACLYSFFVVSFSEKKVFFLILMKPSLSVFKNCAFDVICKKSLPTPRLHRFSTVFFKKFYSSIFYI